MPLVLADVSFLGFHPTPWTLLGLAGNVVFGSRFFVQWIVSERKKSSVIPTSFWWLSILGSLILGVYFLFKVNPETVCSNCGALQHGQVDRDLPGILGSLPNSIIYFRNLQLIRKQKLAAEKFKG